MVLAERPSKNGGSFNCNEKDQENKQTSNNKKLNEEEKINEMFRKSETEEKFRDKWIDIYKKALSTPEKKRNYVIKKCIVGRFTIIDDKIQILPDFDISGKTSADLLKEEWKIN